MLVDTIIHSKCIPPSPSNFCIIRSSLMKKLKSSLEYKCTILHSGAGYGKSTTLTQFLHSENTPFSWYTVTEEDDNILPFLRHLFFSIQRVVPNFGINLPTWENLSQFPKIEELNRWYKLFINCVCEIQETYIIVIDDFHLVDHDFHINYVLEKIVEYLPPHIHLIISSRALPNWSLLRKLKLHKQLLTVSESDFIFSSDEVAVFFEEYVDVPLAEREIAKILELTEGWAISISLLADQWQNKPIHHWLNIHTNDLFSYLSEEVFSRMNEMEQQALLYFSIFPTFSVELITQFYNKEVADKLEQFVKKHVFIQPIASEGIYRFHALFNKFLEMKWEQDSTQFTDLHKRAALYYQKHDNVLSVLHHAFKTNDENFCGKLLEKHAENIMKSGQFEWLLEKINRFSTNKKQVFYKLYFFEGECHRYRAYYEKAKNAYEMCYSLSKSNNDTLFMLKTQAGLAHIYLDTIQPAIAEQYLINALEITKDTQLSQKEHLELQRQYAENLVNLGKAEQASFFIEEVSLNGEVLKTANVDVRILLRTGQLLDAKNLLANRIETPSYITATHRESDLLSSFIFALLGEAKEAWYAAQQGIRRGTREKSIFIEAVGYIRKGNASLLLDFPDYEGACFAYEKAISLMNAINVSRVKAEPYMGLALVKHATGDLVSAKKYVALGLRETEQVQDAWMSALILLTNIKILISENEIENAKQLLFQAHRLFKECGDKFGTMLVYYYHAHISYKEQDSQAFSKHLTQFAEQCLSNGYEFFYQRRTIFGPTQLSIFFEFIQYSRLCEIDNKAIQTITDYFKVDKKVSFPTGSIQLNLLGNLEFSRNNILLDDKEWQRDKSKELFVYLYCNRHRYVPKEEIANALWPEKLLDSLDRDFKVVLNALLKVLEPERNARQESFFISRKNNMYKLQHVNFLQIDVERFLYYSHLGMEEKDPYYSNEWLHLADVSYKGALYSEKKQLEWVSIDREKLQSMHLEVLEKLAQNAVRQHQFKQAIGFAERILRVDSLWEEGYRILMYCYYQLQNRPLALKWYEKCVNQLHEQLNTTPMESTMIVYDLISQ